MEAMASAGVTTPATQDVAWTTSTRHPWRRASRDVPVAPGDLVAFDAGVIVGGYVGELGRTRAVGAMTPSTPGSPALERAVGSAARGVPAGRPALGSPGRLRRRRGSRRRPCRSHGGWGSGSICPS